MYRVKLITLVVVIVIVVIVKMSDVKHIGNNGSQRRVILRKISWIFFCLLTIKSYADVEKFDIDYPIAVVSIYGSFDDMMSR